MASEGLGRTVCWASLRVGREGGPPEHAMPCSDLHATSSAILSRSESDGRGRFVAAMRHAPCDRDDFGDFDHGAPCLPACMHACLHVCIIRRNAARVRISTAVAAMGPDRTGSRGGLTTSLGRVLGRRGLDHVTGAGAGAEGA